MPDQQVEAGEDGVVYLGRSTFKMKVGARLTPAAGTPPLPRPARGATSTSTSLSMSSRSLAKTPAPVRRPGTSHRRRPAAIEGQPGSAARARTMVVGGLCMIAFSLGVMCTVVVDRLWPGARVCAEAQPSGPAPRARADQAKPLPAR